ncbi:anion permease [Thiotrichales bacterium 19S9-12]|nr:anion permease [Thiotrichales bacterium 19S9-11]MCF6811616.1 anion permease [Thiotrichales bacterium 19S9-12]
MYVLQLIIVLFSLLIVLLPFINRNVSPYLTVPSAILILLLFDILDIENIKNTLLNSGPITIICLFVITSALKETGLIYQLGKLILNLNEYHKNLTWIVAFSSVFLLSAFVNNTPIVLVMAPVIVKIARSNRKKPAKYLIPLSYISILGGMCTLIGTSTNIIANDVAISLGLKSFNIFEITIPGAIAAIFGIGYLLLIGVKLVPNSRIIDNDDLKLYAVKFRKIQAAVTVLILISLIISATFNVIPIAILAIIGAIIVLMAQCIDIKKALNAVEWKLILLIYGMLAVSLAMMKLGVIQYIVNHILHLGYIEYPIILFMLVYAISTLMTEFLTNNAVAILVTPIAIQVAYSLGMDATPLIAAVMFGASASFSTPVGYQTNTYIYTLGNYHLFDFIRVGFPLDVIVFTTITIIAYFYWF